MRDFLLLFTETRCGLVFDWHFMAMCLLVYVPDLFSMKQKKEKKPTLLASIKMATVDGSKIQCNGKQIRLSELLKIYSSG